MKNRRILIVGEAYGAEEEKQGRPFVGRSGQLLRNALVDAGFDLNLIDFTNVCMFRPPDNRRPTKKEIDAELPRLIEQCKCYKHVILAGLTARDALCPVLPGHQMSFIYHPSYVLRRGCSYSAYISTLENVWAIIGK